MINPLLYNLPYTRCKLSILLILKRLKIYTAFYTIPIFGVKIGKMV